MSKSGPEGPAMAVMKGKIAEAQEGREVTSTPSLERLAFDSTVIFLRTRCTSDSSLLRRDLT